MEKKMKSRTKFYLPTVVLILPVAFLFVQGADTVAMAGSSDNKGSEISTQATAGDVPPIVMTPHGSIGALKKKIESDFKISGAFALHPDNTLKDLRISDKKQSKTSKIIKRRKAEDFKSNDFYLSEAKNFIAKYSNRFGFENLEINVHSKGVEKRKYPGGAVARFNIYIYEFLLESSNIEIFFGSDDSLIGARFSFPQITPEMYRAVKAAKDNMLPLEEIKEITGRKFVEMALEKGWLVGASPEKYEEAVEWRMGYKRETPILNDKPPYLSWKFVYYPEKPSKRYESYLWSADVDVVTGEILNYSGFDRSKQLDEGTM